MSYYKPWQLRRPPAEPPAPTHPVDKIRCRGRVFRYVVACMHNCEEPRFCPEFWAFFERRGIDPPDYYNEDGIGDRAMRRIVIDCDRCGRKDLDRVYALYRPEGEGEEYELSEEDREALVDEAGFAWDDIGPLLFHVMGELETGRSWVHYCKRCFGQMAEAVGKICQVKPAGKSAKKPAAKKPVAKKPAAEAPAEEAAPAPDKSAEKATKKAAKAPAKKPAKKATGKMRVVDGAAA